jgi:hypothetical protein
MPKTQMDRETDLYTALGDVRWRLAQAAAALQAREPNADLMTAIGDNLDLAAAQLDLLRKGLCRECRVLGVVDRLTLAKTAKN